MNDSLAKRPNAVVLLSGGLDSTTVLAMATEQGFAPYALSFQYGQRHAYELLAAEIVARKLHAVKHVVANIDLREFGGSALTADINVPKGRSAQHMAQGIPVTYVPARNTIMLALALAEAEVTGAADIWFGANAVDYSGYPDCRPEYMRAFETLANLATKAAVEGRRLQLHTPIITLSKSDIIRRGTALGVDYALTVSCYQADAAGRACGVCDSCRLRRAGFEGAGIADPTRYK